MQWGIKLKMVLPRGVSGDAYSLAECILEQGLTGPSPNQLMFSYLQMALSSQLVSHASVLQNISKFSHFNKVHCVLGLLELLCTLPKRIYCEGNAEECMALCMSLLQIVSWVVVCLHSSLLALIDMKSSPEHSRILSMSCDFISSILCNKFTRSLLFVGKTENMSTWSDNERMLDEIARHLSHQHPSCIEKEKINNVIVLLKRIDNLDKPASSVGNCPGAVMCNVSINTAFEVVLHPAGGFHTFVKQIVLISQLEELPRPQLYCDLFRACFQGIIDASLTNEELKWNAFTYIKLPQVLHQMHKSGDVNDVNSALDLLLQYGPLLRIVDAKCNCDCVQFLIKQLVKYELLTEQQGKAIMERKAADGFNLKLAEQAGTPSNPNASLILRAEPTVSSILKTLDADYSKNQDALMNVLCQMLSGKSFELILAAAAATGKVQSFAVKLIKFNEFSKQVQGENQKASHTRAMLFDISFLMLCHICQLYGTEIVTGDGEASESFFYHWATRCLPEGYGKYRALESGIPADSSKVEVLLQQFQSGSELKLTLVKWHDMCINVPAAIQEVLIAWEAGAVSSETVKSILEVIRNQMCCLSVCVSAWLCSCIHTLKHDDRLKPMNMINHLLTPITNADSVSSNANANHNYNERHVLMTTIIRRMFHDLHPVTSLKGNPLVQNIPVKAPISDCLVEIFKATQEKGWMELKSVHTLKHLLQIGGCRWYVDSLIKELLKMTRQDDLKMATRVVHAMFMLDIKVCTLIFISLWQ